MSADCKGCGSPDGCEDCGFCWNCAPPCLGRLAGLPVVSTHNSPQVTPQEFDCGCVTEAAVTDRDALRGEEPFEMRLVRDCGLSDCERAAEGAVV